MCIYKATKLFTPTLNRNIILLKEYLVGVEMTFCLSALKIEHLILLSFSAISFCLCFHKIK